MCRRLSRDSHRRESSPNLQILILWLSLFNVSDGSLANLIGYRLIAAQDALTISCEYRQFRPETARARQGEQHVKHHHIAPGTRYLLIAGFVNILKLFRPTNLPGACLLLIAAMLALPGPAETAGWRRESTADTANLEVDNGTYPTYDDLWSSAVGNSGYSSPHGGFTTAYQ